MSEEDIVAAMRFCFEAMKLVVEPSGAVCIAALLTGAVEARGTRVGVVISGGNIDVPRFVELTGDPSRRDTVAAAPEPRRRRAYPVRVVRDIQIPVRDSSWLAADYSMPATDGRFPAVVEYLPYRKDDLGLSSADAHRYFAARVT